MEEAVAPNAPPCWTDVGPLLPSILTPGDTTALMALVPQLAGVCMLAVSGKVGLPRAKSQQIGAAACSMNMVDESRAQLMQYLWLNEPEVQCRMADANLQPMRCSRPHAAWPQTPKTQQTQCLAKGGEGQIG